jgi:hypothetical protein
MAQRTIKAPATKRTAASKPVPVSAGSEEGTSIQFVGAIIGEAVEQLKRQRRELPSNASSAREAVATAIQQLKETSNQTEQLCLPGWYMPQR